MFWKPRKDYAIFYLLYVPGSSICVMLHLCHVMSTKIMDMIMLFFDLLYVTVSSMNRSWMNRQTRQPKRRSALVKPRRIGSTSGGLRDLRRCVRSWERVFFLNFVCFISCRITQSLSNLTEHDPGRRRWNLIGCLLA